MPVTKSSTLAAVLTGLVVDMRAGQITVQFTKLVDGEPMGSAEMLLAGPDLGAFLAEMPVAGKPRGTDLTDAFYQKAIDMGVIEGAIS
jgi:hypothetical protein